MIVSHNCTSSSAQNSAYIHCKNLQWGSPGQPLTPALNLEFLQGSLTAICGTNGSGKSSLLKVISGLQKPLAGEVAISAGRYDISYLQQQQAIDKQFPINLLELISTGLWRRQLTKNHRQCALKKAINDWQLQGLESRCLYALSGGELQRGLLARMSLMNASVLLLDEPDAALDEQGQTLLWQHIRQWQAEGRTQLIVSHNYAAMQKLVEKTLLISRTSCRLVITDKEISVDKTVIQIA